MAVNAVIEKFQQNSSLLALPVENEGLFEGLTTRRSLFFKHLSKPFARDIYYRKPIRMLLDINPMLMPSDWDVHQGLQELLNRDPALENDCFGIIEDKRCIGIVAVSDLIMTISRMQGKLLETLEMLSSRIRHEVEMAHRIQTELLPDTPMQHAGISVSAALVNSSEISGDFYDLFLLGDNKLGLLVADVTGHGVQAGLVTTAAKAGLQVLLDNGISNPGELLYGMNRAVLATARQQLMMTALIALIEPETNKLTISSAGHPYPWLFDASTSEWSEIEIDAGFPLGFDEQAVYGEMIIQFNVGDMFLMFSDGIIESENCFAEAFGQNKFKQTLKTGRQLSPEQLKDLLLAEAREFACQDSFDDDVTLLIAGR